MARSAVIPAIADTREQRPWTLGPSCSIVRRATLDAGDYSLVGFERRVAIERKSKEDLVGTLVHDAARFDAELEKLRWYDFSAVVVECDLPTILSGDYRSQMPATALLERIVRVQVEFGVPVHFCGDRVASQRFADELLAQAREAMNQGTTRKTGGKSRWQRRRNSGAR